MTGRASELRNDFLVRRLLFIEDEVGFRHGIAKSLRLRGCEVVEVGDPDAALAAEPEEMDAILADVVLGPRLIHEIVSELRRRAPVAPLVVLTGNASPAQAAALIPLGVHSILDKPSDVDAIVGTLEEAARELLCARPDGTIDFASVPRPRRSHVVRWAVRRTGSKASAARLLGISRSAVQQRLRGLPALTSIGWPPATPT